MLDGRVPGQQGRSPEDRGVGFVQRWVVGMGEGWRGFGLGLLFFLCCFRLLLLTVGKDSWSVVTVAHAGGMKKSADLC